MYEARKAMLGAALSMELLAGCTTAPEPAPLAEMPEIETVQVACVEVDGLLPLTDAACQDYANHVERGFALFSRLTNNVIPPPKSVVAKHYPEPLPIKDARARRCTRLDDEKNVENAKRASDFADEVAKLALSRAVGIDFSKGLLYVTTNAPTSLCVQAGPVLPRPVNHAEHCTPKASHPLFPGGQAMVPFDKPTILTYTTTNDKLLEETAAHERGHWGVHGVRLGHEYVLCAKKDDQVPTVIHSSEPDLGVDIEGQRGSLMSYADSPSYLAPPQLAYLDVVPQGRVINATGPGPSEFNLREAAQQGIMVQVPLTNSTIKALVASELPDGRDIAAYCLWIGKIPGQSGVAIHAAPEVKLGKQLPGAPIFLLDVLKPGQSFTVDGDATITENSEAAGVASIRIEKPKGA